MDTSASMYTISNKDIMQAIELIEIAAKVLSENTSPRARNKGRMASLLARKLKEKVCELRSSD